MNQEKRQLSQFSRLLHQRQDPVLQIVRRERPYRIPKGYMHWDTLSAIVAISLASLDPSQPQPSDLASLLNINRLGLWFVQGAPLYCISTPLLRAFEQTDIHEKQSLLEDLNPPLATMLLLFPANSIKTPDGAPLDFAVVHLADKRWPQLSTGEACGFKVPYLDHEHEINVHWSGISADETCWFSGMGLKHDGTILTSDEQLGSSVCTAEDRAFLAKMRSIILQCLLGLTYRPDLFENEPIPSSGGAGRKHKPSHQKERGPLYPRWIGKHYSKPIPAGVGSHASPREHWRKGHWKRVAIGVGRIERRWVWIEPTFVSASSA